MPAQMVCACVLAASCSAIVGTLSEPTEMVLQLSACSAFCTDRFCAGPQVSSSAEMLIFWTNVWL